MATQEAAFGDEEFDLDEKCVGENDLKKLKSSHFTAGVREGIVAGTQSTLQGGFNCGYKDGFFKSCNFGKVRGVLCGLLSYVSLENRNKNSDNKKQKDRIYKLVSELDNIEEEYWKITYTTTSRSALNSECTLGKTCYSHGGNEMAGQQLTVNEFSKLKDFVVQCRHFCDELGLNPDIVRISYETT